MTYSDFEKEAEEGIEFAAKHQNEIDPAIAEGSGMEQYNVFLRKYEALAEDLEHLPFIIKQVLGKFSEKALWEVVHGETQSKPHHKRIIEGLYAFLETYKDDLKLMAEEEREQSEEEIPRDSASVLQ